MRSEKGTTRQERGAIPAATDIQGFDGPSRGDSKYSLRTNAAIKPRELLEIVLTDAARLIRRAVVTDSGLKMGRAVVGRPINHLLHSAHPAAEIHSHLQRIPAYSVPARAVLPSGERIPVVLTGVRAEHIPASTGDIIWLIEASGAGEHLQDASGDDSQIVEPSLNSGRMAFHARLLDEIRTAKVGSRISVVRMDLLAFGRLNQQLGETVGNQVLAKFLERLEAFAQLYDRDYAFWLGADEFGISVTHQNEELVSEIATGALALAEAPFHLSRTVIRLGCNVGVACWPYDAKNSLELSTASEIALLASKRIAGRQIQYSSRVALAIPQYHGLGRADIDRAIDGNQFMVHFQPKVRAGTHEVVSVEALIRWRHPELGLVPPSEFIPMAEQTGAVTSITEWVIKNSIGAMERMPKYLRSQLGLCINLSSVDLRNPRRITKLLLDNLVRSVISPRQITIEITETAMAENSSLLREHLAQLRALGMRISIDDFGTGYSSLSQLRDMPVDEVKIDQSFVRAMSTNSESAVIVRGVIGLARGLGVEVVAEGVEHEDEAAMLERANCDFLQGYWIGKPMPMPNLSKFLSSKPHTYLQRRRRSGQPRSPAEISRLLSSLPQ